MSGNPACSIVIPAYNETARIAGSLHAVTSCIRTRGWDAEIIVVDDGSTDTTARQVLDFSLSAPQVRLLENPSRRGKGFAVRHGLLQARGEIVLFTDAHLSVPIAEAESLFAAIRAGADIAIGSRWLNSPGRRRRQPLQRQICSRCCNLIARWGLGLRFTDIQCGFKAFTREAAQNIFQLQTVEGRGFDAEILFIARQRQLRIVEAPVAWSYVEGSQPARFRDGMQMMREMASILRNAMLGRYNRPAAQFKRPAG